MKGREYKGYVYVDVATLKTPEEFTHWIGLALDFNKQAKVSKKKLKSNPRG